MQRTRVITVAGNVDRETAIAEMLSREPHAELVLRCLDRAELLAAVRGAMIDLVVCVGAPPWLDLHALSEIAEHGARLVGVASDPLEAESLRRLGVPLASPASGIREIVDNEPTESSPATAGDDAPRAPSGRLVAVWGPKGAPGRSTVSVELASEIASNGTSTALVDADTYGGDLSQMLAVVEELPTTVWAAQAAADGHLDGRSLRTMLRRTGARGPVLLPGINRPELWTDISRYAWERLISVFSSFFAFTVMDLGFGIEHDDRTRQDRDRLTRQTIGAADHVVAVCRADPIGIKTFLWSIERLKDLRPLDDVLVVANRVAAGDADEVRYVLKKHLGKRPIVCLPTRHAEVRAAVDRGVPIREVKPSGDIASQIRELAAAVGAPIPPRGLLTRLGGRA